METQSFVPLMCCHYILAFEKTLQILTKTGALSGSAKIKMSYHHVYFYITVLLFIMFLYFQTT